jgi:hypothetical protein
MLHVLIAISQKFCCRKEIWGYAKVRKKKKIDTKMFQILKHNGYKDAHLKKK